MSAYVHTYDEIWIGMVLNKSTHGKEKWIQFAGNGSNYDEINNENGTAG